MSRFIMVQNRYHKIHQLINVDFITTIQRTGDGGAVIEFASDQKQTVLINAEDYKKVHDLLTIVE